MNTKINITLIKSTIGKPLKQRSIVEGLGLNKLNRTVSLLDTPEVRGMINKISHMLNVVK